MGRPERSVLLLNENALFGEAYAAQMDTPYSPSLTPFFVAGIIFLFSMSLKTILAINAISLEVKDLRK